MEYYDNVELNKFINKAKSYVNDHVIPHASQYDSEEKIPMNDILKMAQNGYLGSMISQKYGGMGADMIKIGYLNEEFGRGCTSLRSLLTVQGMVAIAIEKWGSEEQRLKWLHRLAAGEVIGAFGLSEPNVGSDARSVETKAILENDHYVINGEKKWITMGQIANLHIIFAHVDGEVTAFLVERDTPGVNVKPLKGLLGARGSMLTHIELENCRVPKENIIGTVGTGLSHVALSCLDYGRYTVAWGCVGLAQACLDESIKYCSERKQFGKPLKKHQLIQKMITEMIVDVKAARLMCLNAGRLKEEADIDSISEVWCAKYKASKVVNKVAADAVQILGATGYCNEHFVERYFRDAKMAEIIEGTSQVHELIISSNVFRNHV